MRKNLLCFLIPLFVLSCIKREDMQTISENGNVLTVNIGCALTRTFIDGASSEDRVPVMWSVGDVVNINGQKSSEYEGAEKRYSAEFKINNVFAPYKLVYPHSCYKAEDEDGTILIEVPSTQKYTPNSFAVGSMIMYGYSESETINCQYACGAIKIGLKSSDSRSVASITITSLSSEACIAGDFRINSVDGNVTPCGNGSRSIEIEMPEGGVEITDDCTYFIAAIPAGTYPDGFELKMIDFDKKVMRRLWLRHSQGSEKGVTIAPGQIISFDNQDFETDSREICTAADWEEFANLYNNGEDWQSMWLSKKGTVVIGKDFSADRLTRIDNLGSDVTIDGKGHQITQTLAEKPLFGTVEGCVKNLTLSGNMNAVDPYASGASAFCSTLAGGTISGCLNRMNINIDADHKDKAVKAGSFAAEMSGGNIIDCINDGKLEIKTGLASSKEVMAGGLVGVVNGLSSQAFITDCNNNADVFVSIEKAAAGTSRPNKAGYGGIVGIVLDGDQDNFLTIAGCVNKGDVSVSFATDPTSAANFSLSGAGGIIGANTSFNSDGNFPTSPSGYYVRILDSSNYGDIYNGLASNASSTLLDDVCAGGIAGIMMGLESAHADIENSQNYGVVKTYEGTTFKRATYVNVCGGLCGIGGWVDFKQCSVISEQIGTNKGRTYSVSAGIGLAIKSFKMENCKIGADIHVIRCTDFTENSYSLAFCATKTSKSGNVDKKYGMDLNGSTISGCYFKGTITTNSTLANANNTAAITTSSTVLTKDSYEAYIISRTSGDTPVILEGNSFWEE